MADRIINYDGKKERHLIFTSQSLCDAEAVTGTGFGDVTLNPIKLANISILRGYLWAGFKHEDEDLTIEDVNVMITESMKSKKATIASMIDDIREAWAEGGWVTRMISTKKNKAKDPNESAGAAENKQ